jgi:hypothetical protein
VPEERNGLLEAAEVEEEFESALEEVVRGARRSGCLPIQQ